MPTRFRSTLLMQGFRIWNGSQRCKSLALPWNAWTWLITNCFRHWFTGQNPCKKIKKEGLATPTALVPKTISLEKMIFLVLWSCVAIKPSQVIWRHETTHGRPYYLKHWRQNLAEKAKDFNLYSKLDQSTTLLSSLLGEPPDWSLKIIHLIKTRDRLLKLPLISSHDQLVQCKVILDHQKCSVQRGGV